MPAARILALTEQIYDAAVGGTPWDSVGHGLAALVHARSASLMAGDVARGAVELLSHANIPEEAVAAYGTRYRHVDLWTARAARHATGPEARIYTSGHLVPEEEFLRSEFWNEFGRRYGLRYVLGTVLPLGAAGAMPVGLHRPAGAPPFAEEEKRLLEAVLPHLRRALQLRHRLAAAEARAPGPEPGLAALDGLSTGIVVLDAELGVTLANFAAEALAKRSAGFRFSQTRSAAGRRTGFEPLRREERDGLLALVAGAAIRGEAGGAMRLSAGPGKPPVAVLVTPLPARLAGPSLTLAGRVPGRALVMLRELGEAAAPRIGVLRDLFGLTAAEAEVARALAGGATKSSVALARGIAETTVRTQVRAVLTKTGAANLRDLERLLAGLSGL
jgi:DNA-binding CsgD family transcriptional regulator